MTGEETETRGLAPTAERGVQDKPPRRSLLQARQGFRSHLGRSHLKKGRSGRVLTPGPSAGGPRLRAVPPCSPAFARLSLPPEDPSASRGSEAGASGKPSADSRPEALTARRGKSGPLPDAPRRDLPGTLRAQGRGAGLWDPAFGSPVVPLPLGPHPPRAAGLREGTVEPLRAQSSAQLRGAARVQAAAEGPQRRPGARTVVARGTGGQAETRTPGISQPTSPPA